MDESVMTCDKIDAGADANDIICNIQNFYILLVFFD